MKCYRKLEELPAEYRRGAVTIGNFDGVHRGHARIIEQLIRRAREVDGPAVVFTFDPHPVRLLRPDEAPPPLTWTERKAELLGELGVDAVIAYPTDERLLELSAEEFFEQIVGQQLQARAMVEGPNFFFGHNRSGTIESLKQLCEASGRVLEVVPPVQLDGHYISSSRIRERIRTGDVGAASNMLTRPYRIRGMVTHGAGRGAKIGFPTANLSAIDTLVPGHGVYAAIARFAGDLYPAAVNIGPNPTFGEQISKFEAHLIGFAGTLYGEPLEVDFLQQVRQIHTFDSLSDLQAQLRRDVAEVEQRVATFRDAGA